MRSAFPFPPENVASAFGRHGYELLIHPHDPATINYDRSRYALLPETEKAKIESYIEFVINQNEKQTIKSYFSVSKPPSGGFLLPILLPNR